MPRSNADHNRTNPNMMRSAPETWVQIASVSGIRLLRPRPFSALFEISLYFSRDAIRFPTTAPPPARRCGWEFRW